MNQDNLLILAILFMCFAPILFFAAIGAGIGGILHAPKLLPRIGVDAPPWAARAAAGLLILVALFVVAPQMAWFVVGLAVFVLPLMIFLLLLIACCVGAARHDESFGAVFWRIAAPVPLMCAFFVVLLVPFTAHKLSIIEAHQALARESQDRPR